mgnify:CR=1 FL=1
MRGISDKLTLRELSRYRLGTFADIIYRNAVLVPTQLISLLNLPDLEQYELPCLKRVWYAASPMPIEVLKRGLSVFGPIFMQGYGQTESGPDVTVLSRSDHRKEQVVLASCGQPCSGVHVRIVDEAGHDVEAEIQLIGDMGVTMKTGVEIGKDKTIAQLRQEGLRAFFIAIGAQECMRLGVEGEDLEGVYPGLDYLRLVNLGEAVALGKKVAVIGGGNVAMDAVRSARRLGAENAFILYRRSLEEMPSRGEEIEECREEGIPIHTLTQPVRFIGENGRVKAIKCVRTRLTELDESGRRSPEPVPGSEFTIEVDAVITALGQEADWSCLTPECACTLTDWGTMSVDPLTLQSDDPDIFAGGDAVRGPQTVIEAIADGRQAAISIDRYLRRLNLRLGRGLAWKAITQPQKEKYDPAARIEMPCLEPQERVKNFAEVRRGFTEEMAVQEARRCISCGACCVQTCPYDVMQFNHDLLKAAKCDLCVEKRGWGEAPACITVCPTRCIFWGDVAGFPSGMEVAI